MTVWLSLLKGCIALMSTVKITIFVLQQFAQVLNHIIIMQHGGHALPMTFQ